MGKDIGLTIGGGSDWHFVNGSWFDGEDGLVAVENEYLIADGDAMQCNHWAFNKALCYKDCTARFEIKLNPHTDTGIVLRARDESHFYVLHFPNCGQGSRAQHFWAALSIMDDSGYLKNVKLEMVRRVPSQIGIWLPVEVTMKGSRFLVKVGDYGLFEAEDHTYPGFGHIGLHQSLSAQIRNITIQGDPAPFTVWNHDEKQRVNWFHPLPTSDKVWQQPIDVKRFPDGELVMLVGIQGDKRQDDDAKSVQHLSRSTDNGRTWSTQEKVEIGDSGSSWGGARMHITPRGRLIAVMGGTDHKLVRESKDRGRTWSEPVKVNLHVGPPLEKPVQQLSPQGFLNLRDGGIVAFMLKVHPLKDPALNIWTWGSLHCQAFTSRSDDDGLTWTDPVNMDTPGFDAEGKPYEGNLDLTEPSAIELVNGRIMAFIRPVYSAWMWETWSDDDGKSWGPCVRGPFPGYAAPNMVRTASGAILIAHRMPSLCVNCSLDDGLTWDQGTTIDTGLWAMGSMVEVEPDLVLYVYWDTIETQMRAQYLRVTPSGIQPYR